jgi:hypothetical protein
MNRRTFLERSTMAAAALGLNGPPGDMSPAPPSPKASAPQGPQTVNAIRIDPTPLFELSPYLYMQFMEPLGVTDGLWRRHGIICATTGATTSWNHA